MVNYLVSTPWWCFAKGLCQTSTRITRKTRKGRLIGFVIVALSPVTVPYINCSQWTTTDESKKNCNKILLLISLGIFKSEFFSWRPALYWKQAICTGEFKKINKSILNIKWILSLSCCINYDLNRIHLYFSLKIILLSLLFRKSSR